MTAGGSRDARGGVVLGVVLIALGGLFLAERAAGFDLFEAGWPLLIVVPGALLLAWGIATGGREGVGLAVGGGITTVVGLILAVQNATGLWATWAYAWALVGPGGTGVGLIAYGLAHGDRGHLASGLRSLGWGLVLFFAFGLFFEGVIGLSGRPLLTAEVAPVVLIAAGLVILVGGFVKGREQRV